MEFMQLLATTMIPTPQLTLVLTGLVSALYAAGAIALVRSFLREQAINKISLSGYTAIVLFLHALVIHSGSFSDKGFSLSLFSVASLIFWTINLIVFVSSARKPLHNLFILLYPLSALCLAAVALATPHTHTYLNYTVASHVILSLLAYSLLTIASVQALILAYQNHKLRQKQLQTRAGFLPPLMTMESLLFEFIWVGVVLLTLSILSGFWFLDDMFAQHLVHKTVFAIIAWCIYVTLLIGRVAYGWRGYKAIRWTLVGFLFLMLAYFGSKFVLEVLLG